MSKAGAPAAYRGYRLQALYALKRILTFATDPGPVFHPEGHEDLDIRDTNDRLLETIQVKSYENLVLSDLEPAKLGSFFHRVATLLNSPNVPHIKLVNFGSIGPEMNRAWAEDGTHRAHVAQKLKEYGLQDQSIRGIFDCVELVELDEPQEKQIVNSHLQNTLTGVDPDSAFDLLNAWLYNAAEHREHVTQSDVIERINNVGRFLAERHAHHREWFTSIMPLTDRDIPDDQCTELRDEFYAGVAARYEHILAGLDFRRENKLAQIAAKFETSRVVIIHGASGQGKTALALRYLHDTYPDVWRFAVDVIENRQHAIKIASALAGHANAVRLPMAVYIDVSPRDTAWIELVERLARHSGLHILVTIREEDFRRTSVSGAELDYETVELTFDETEAKLIYDRAVAPGQGTEFLGFDEAWDRFGGKGPLMEFVYLLTQTTTLRARLEEQVHRIRDEIRERNVHPDELVLLRLVSIASAYEARLHTARLIGQLDLPDPDHTLRLLDKEYLIRLSSDGYYVEGLHPIRSRILTDLLITPDVTPWIDSAIRVLPSMVEEDIESFVLHALVERPLEGSRLLDALKELQLGTWAGLGSVLHVLLWSSARDYVEQNLTVIDRAHKEFGQSWLFIIDFDLTGVTTPEMADSWARLRDFFPEERWTAMQDVRASQTPKVNAMQSAKMWLAQQHNKPRPPLSTTDWEDASEICFWGAWWEVAPHVEKWLSDDDLDCATKDLDLSRLADLSLALYQCNQERHAEWIQRGLSTLQVRLAQEYSILVLEKQEDVLKSHYWPVRYDQDKQETDESKGASGDPYHEQAMERIRLARRLLPGYRAYGTQGYGYRVGHLPSPVDESSVNKEGVPASMLPPSWLTRVNATANGLARNTFRPETWYEYLDQILQTRRCVVMCLDQLHKGLLKCLQRRKGRDLFQKCIDASLWDQCRTLLGDRPLLPRSAVDRWGFAHEFLSNEFVQYLSQQTDLPRAIALQKYKPYLDAEREYSSSLIGFLQQSPNVMVTNFWIGDLPAHLSQRDQRLKILQEHGFKTDLEYLATLNLTDAKKRLATYQGQFRSLLEHLVNKDELSTLEARECDLLLSVWPLWYFYAYKPDQRWASPSSQIASQVNLAKHEMMRRVQQALDKVSEGGTQVDVLPIEEVWEGTSTLWLRLGLHDPTMLHIKFEELVIALRDNIGPVAHGRLEHYVIEENWQYIAIVPVVRGRTLDRSARRLLTFSTVQSDKDLSENPWLYMPLPIPSDAWEAIEIDLWDLEEIRLVDRLSSAVAGVYLYVCHLSDLKGMPEIPDPVFPIVQSYTESTSQKINQLLDIAFDAIPEMRARFDQLPEPEQDRRKHLSEAMAGLAEVHRLLQPSNEPSESYAVSVDELADYAQRLQQAQQLTEGIKLFWIADVLDHPSDRENPEQSKLMSCVRLEDERTLGLGL